MLQPKSGLHWNRVEHVGLLLCENRRLDSQLSALEVPFTAADKKTVEGGNLQFSLYNRTKRVIYQVFFVVDDRLAIPDEQPPDKNGSGTNRYCQLVRGPFIRPDNKGFEDSYLGSLLVSEQLAKLLQIERYTAQVEGAHVSSAPLYRADDSLVQQGVDRAANRHRTDFETAAKLRFGRQTIAGKINTFCDLVL